MEVPDISEVPRVRWIAGIAKTHDHTSSKRWNRDTGLVGGLGRAEHDAQAEPGGDRVGVSDGARVEHGSFKEYSSAS